MFTEELLSALSTMNAVEVWVAGGRGWLVDLTENRPICLREFPAVVGWLRHGNLHTFGLHSSLFE